MAASDRKIEEQVEYKDGSLYWTHPRKRSLVGKECGYINKGYRKMKCQGRNELVHRVIWFICKGSWPLDSKDIDHINQNKLDNRIENLREVSRSTNAFNNKALNVSLNGNNWRARIGQQYIGTFKTQEEALTAAKEYKQTYLGTYCGFVEVKERCGNYP